jgi:integrase
MAKKLKGVQRFKKKNAQGAIVTYYYLRGVGKITPLTGDENLPFWPGTTAFLKAYNAALNRENDCTPTPRPRPSMQVVPEIKSIASTIRTLILAYRASINFTSLSQRTRGDYTRVLTEVETKWGGYYLSDFEKKDIRPQLLAWRDERAKASPRQADMIMTVFGTVLNWAIDRGYLSHNYAAKPGRTYVADRSEMIWTVAHQEQFLAKCEPMMRLPFLIAINTGQRQADILNLTWERIREGRLFLRQSKRGRRVDMPFTDDLAAALEVERRRGYQLEDSDFVLLNTLKRPWSSNSFQQAFLRSVRLADLGESGLHFHDLRGTLCTMLDDAGCTNEEIGQILGWKLTYVVRMLEIYKSANPEATNSGIAKLEKHIKATRSAA